MMSLLCKSHKSLPIQSQQSSLVDVLWSICSEVWYHGVPVDWHGGNLSLKAVETSNPKKESITG